MAAETAPESLGGDPVGAAAAAPTGAAGITEDPHPDAAPAASTTATDPDGDDEGSRGGAWSLAAAIILSCATLASAWSGFQASVWNSVYSTESRSANTSRLEAVRHADFADRQLITDVMLFSTWFEAELDGNSGHAQQVADRFQDHLIPAFEAWRALPAADGELPAGSPFDQPEYNPPRLVAAEEANERANEAVVRADEASEISTRYVLSTVLFASVLFLAGIADKLRNRRAAKVVVVLAAVTLVGAVFVLLSLPVRLN